MTRRTITELVAQANTTLPDNITGLIDPADVRNMIIDFLDTIRPSYAVMDITTGVSKAATAAYSTFPWSSSQEATAPDWSVSLASGTAIRSGGPATTRITFNIDMVTTNNAIVTFALFVNGVQSPWASSNTSTSATDVQSLAFAALLYSNAVTINYQIQIKTTLPGNVVLSNGSVVFENVPVNQY